MIGFQQIGATVALVAGTPLAADVGGVTELLVSNESATTWGYFSLTQTAVAPGAGVGVPVAPNSQIVVRTTSTAAYWNAVGAGLTVTPGAAF